MIKIDLKSNSFKNVKSIKTNMKAELTKTELSLLFPAMAEAVEQVYAFW